MTLVQPNTMQFQVTQIEFDFDDDYAEFDDSSEIENYYQNVTDEVLATSWFATDEDDLIEEITCASGWCIKSIDYNIVLN